MIWYAYIKWGVCDVSKIEWCRPNNKIPVCIYIYKHIYNYNNIIYIYIYNTYIIYFSSFLSLSGIKIKNLFTLDKIYEKVITTLSPPSYYKNSPHNLETISQYIIIFIQTYLEYCTIWDNQYATNNLLFRFIILVCTRIHYYMFVCV